MKKTLLLPFALVTLAACSPSESPDTAYVDTVVNTGSKTAGEVTVTSENGYVDIWLDITGTEKKDSATLYHIAGVYKGAPVGFDVTIPPARAGSGFGHGLIISSIGTPSDNFLEMLCEFYELPFEEGTQFRKTDTLAFVDLAKMAEEMGGQNVSGNSLKVFFEEDGETEDDSKTAEVYLNVDERLNRVEFDEKDPEYRKDLIYFLTEQK